MLGLPSASGPHLYNPSYVKFALAAPCSVVWALESPPYPAKIELDNVTYRVDPKRVPLEGCGLVPRAVAAVVEKIKTCISAICSAATASGGPASSRTA